MEIHPSLVIRSMLFGCILIIVLTTFITANANSPLMIQQTDTEARSSDVESCEISPDFPQKVRRWCDLIEQYAHQHKLPPDLLAALIWQESGGNPSVLSRSGAVGLMQVMPSDGIARSFQCPNGPCFAKRPTIAQLKDPEFNIQYGARMLANLVKRQGSLRDALKAYGPMEVGYYYADKVLGIYQKYGG
jgi:soluble lytic murein transglycosylase-like protein